MKINVDPDAPVIVRQSILIQAPPARVWELLSDISSWHHWHRQIERPILKGELRPGTTFHWRSNGVGINSILHTVEPLRSIGWTGSSLGIHAIHNWEIEAVPHGTLVIVDESMRGMLAKFFRRMFNNSLEDSLRSWLLSLKTEAEKWDDLENTSLISNADMR